MDHYNIEQQLKRFPRITLPSHKLNIHTLRWSPEGSRIASGGKDKTLNLHRVKESEIVVDQQFSNNGHTNDIDQLCWDPENNDLLATASLDRHVKIWDVRYLDPIASIKLKSENMSVAWSNNGTTIAVADKSDVVSFIDTRAGFKVFKDQKFQFEVGDIAWTKEDDLFFIATGDGKVHVLSLPDLQTLYIIDAFASPCVCMRFDQTGKYFAISSNEAVTGIWDCENLACMQAIDRLEWPVKTVSFSCDSKYIASGSDDSFIDVADIKTGEQVVSIEVNNPTLTLDFHPKEYILAYALNEHEYRDYGTIRIVGFPDERCRLYV